MALGVLDALAVRTLTDAVGAVEIGSPGADRAARAVRRGERAVTLVVRGRDERVVLAALAALG